MHATTLKKVKTSRIIAAIAAGALGLAACTQAPLPSSTPTTSPAECPDFATPGAAATMIGQLLDKLGSRQTVMVEIRSRELAVTALVDGAPSTWACRAGVVQQVTSDIAYVDQASFDVTGFDIGDVGSLFRAAAAIAGSSENQMLQIVDYSGGRVMMAVTTNPESRTVFFNADGSILEDLDFDTLGGIERGLQDVDENASLVLQVTIDSAKGAWADAPGVDAGTIVRRQRTPRIPVTTVTRTERAALQTFSPALIDPDAIWGVVAGSRTPNTPWSVSIDDRERTGVPHLHFAFGQSTLVTDLLGHPVTTH